MDRLGVVKKLTDRILGTQHVQHRMARMPRHDRQLSLALRPPPQPDAPHQPPFVTQPSPRRRVAAVGQLTLRTTHPTHERALRRPTIAYRGTRPYPRVRAADRASRDSCRRQSTPRPRATWTAQHATPGTRARP